MGSTARTHCKEYQALLERLIAGRKAAGLTQRDVAMRLGRPQSFVSKCESGERRIDPIELAEFAHIYEKQISYFLGES